MWKDIAEEQQGGDEKSLSYAEQTQSLSGSGAAKHSGPEAGICPKTESTTEPEG